MQIDLDFKLQNRAESAIKLIESFSDQFFKNRENWIFCALSLNAVPLSNILSKRFDISYDILLSDILYAPQNKECEIAVINENSELVIHEELVKSFDISLDYVYAQSQRIYEEEILKKIDRFRNGRKPILFKDKNLLFIDDEANSLRALAGIKSALKQEAKNISYMCAVIPKEMEILLEKNIDNIFYLYSAGNYIDNQHYYIEKLRDLKDDEVLEILKNSENFVENIENDEIR
jgi:putative phosphoribosyl transferase